MIAGLAPDELLATMFIIGRRYGLREAAASMLGIDVPDVLPEL